MGRASGLNRCEIGIYRSDVRSDGHVEVPDEDLPFDGLVDVPLLLLPWSAAVGDPVNVHSPGEGRTVTVVITSSGYSPAAVTAQHGDVIRFVQMNVRAHHVEFRDAPAGARMVPEYGPSVDLSPEAVRVQPPLRVGPYLLGPGETYEVRIDEYLPEGAYLFGCSSHDGWRGVFVVEDFDDLP